MDIYNLLAQYASKWKRIGPQHDKIGQVRRLMNGAHPNDSFGFAVEGIWAHHKLLQANVEIQTLFLCPERIYSDEAFQLAASLLNRTRDVYVISDKLLCKLSDRDDPDGFLSIGKVPEWDPDELRIRDKAVVVVLDGLENPGNIGTILRTCDGAGVNAVLVCNARARLTHPKLIKSSMGAVFAVPVLPFEDVASCMDWLARRGFHLYLADPGAQMTYKNFSYEGKTALIVGSERYGLSAEWDKRDSRKLSIPMLGLGDSLNVGIAASIVVYEICMNNLNR